jgi:uncharacterized membrane protein
MSSNASLLPTGIFHSSAFGVSADGCMVVGHSVSAEGFEAFRWTEVDGVQSVRDNPEGNAEG